MMREAGLDTDDLRVVRTGGLSRLKLFDGISEGLFRERGERPLDNLRERLHSDSHDLQLENWIPGSVL